MEISSFIELVTFLESYKARNSYLFRGQSNAVWPLVPKAGRSEYHNHYTPNFSEKEVFESWVRYAKYYITKQPDNDWDWLAIAQHYGLATRLLDWTKNPLVAAYFSCWENEETDGSIYIYKMKDSFGPDTKYPYDYKGFTVFFPSGVASRIINQRGLFTISDKPNVPIDEKVKSIKKVIIRKEAKKDILTSLEFFNINQFSLYQDLNSLSDYLNRYLTHSTNRASLNDLEGNLVMDDILKSPPMG